MVECEVKYAPWWLSLNRFSFPDLWGSLGMRLFWHGKLQLQKILYSWYGLAGCKLLLCSAVDHEKGRRKLSLLLAYMHVLLQKSPLQLLLLKKWKQNETTTKVENTAAHSVINIKFALNHYPVVCVVLNFEHIILPCIPSFDYDQILQARQFRWKLAIDVIMIVRDSACQTVCCHMQRIC